MLSLTVAPLSLSAPVVSRVGAGPTMMAKAGNAKAELESLAEAQQIPMGFWDPLGLADQESIHARRT